MHADKRAEKIQGRGPEGKTIVAAVLERGGKVRAKVCRTRAESLNFRRSFASNVEAGSTVYSDELKSLRWS